MTPNDRRRLRELAEKASPGPWYTTGLPWFQVSSGVLTGSPDPHVGYMIADCEAWDGEREEYVENDGPAKISDADADAAYIAAAHPGVMIELLDALEKAERRE